MAVVHARTSRILFTLLVAASVVWGCDAAVKPSGSEPSVTPSPSTSEASADALASPSETAEASDSAEPSGSLEPSASPSDIATASPTVGPTPTPTPTPVKVRFTQSIADHRWGDAPFRVRAAATGGRAVRFAANGGCRVDGKSGTVTIQSVGQCAITANVPGAKPPATASQTFKILRATPVITVKNQSTRFANPMRYAVKVTVSPRIPLKFTIKHKTAEDAWCKVTSSGILTFSRQPTSEVDEFPHVPLDCYVQVAAGASSPNYVTPAADVARITIGYPPIHVVPRPEDIVFSKGPSVTFDIQETSGAALGMEVQVNDGDCSVGTASPVHPTSRTTRYKITVTAGSSGTYDCTFFAQAKPQDYFPGNPLVPFTVHVTP